MAPDQSVRLWHVTVTVAGGHVEPLIARSALARLAEQRPFLEVAPAGSDGAVLTYWDEGDAMLDVASLALRLWAEHRDSAGLPAWEVVGLEVLEKGVREGRGRLRDGTAGSPTPVLPFPQS